jgi:hypothetical protein
LAYWLHAPNPTCQHCGRPVVVCSDQNYTYNDDTEYEYLCPFCGQISLFYPNNVVTQFRLPPGAAIGKPVDEEQD